MLFARADHPVRRNYMGDWILGDFSIAVRKKIRRSIRGHLPLPIPFRSWPPGAEGLLEELEKLIRR